MKGNREISRFTLSILTIALLFITGCAHYISIYRLPLGDETLRKLHVTVHRNEIWNLETGARVTFDDMIDTFADRSIIYVGEKHDNIKHHMLQLNIIKALYRKNPNLIIGMEMFQRPYQDILDRWTGGELTEEAFLDEVEWYYRWDIPYGYYKDILNFAKENKIRLVAMNIPGGILSKVVYKGFDALTKDEKKMLPTMTPVTKGYKDYMKNNYKGHPGAHNRSFEGFVATQSLWDDAMAENILLAIERNTFDNPQMVVVAGGGHIVYGLGIPDRVYRRSNLSYAIILPVGLKKKETIDVAQSIGTFVVGTEHSPPLQPVPQLGIAFTQVKDGGKGLLIRHIKMDSVAEKAGIKENDIMISFDGVEIKKSHTLTRLLREDIWDKTVEIVLQREDKMVTVKATFIHAKI